MRRTKLALLALPLAIAACTTSGTPAPIVAALAAPPAAAPGTANPALWPSPAWPAARDAAVEARISALIARMSIEEKVGQTVQADISSVTPADARTYHLGSILNGGNSAPGGNEFAPPQEWLALADAFYDASVDTSGGRVAIPIIWGTDAVHGHSNIVGATLFPHNIGLGAARNPDLIEAIGRATALEIRATGMEWTFAPTVTVPQDFRWGRAYEGYSSDPALVTSYVERMIRGLQGPATNSNMLAGPYVLASTKHFLADGGTFEGRDQGDARISETVLRDVHGAPYVPAIEQGVGSIMVSYSSWNGVKMTGNRSLLNDVLKERMNFDGFIVSDWNGHGQVPGCTNTDCPEAINAGLDMYMAPDSWRDLWHSLVAQARSGEVPMARLDDAVRRVLRQKMRLGLFEAGRPSSRRYAGDWGLLGHADHRVIARQAVRESLVLLKHQGGVLPLRPGSHIMVAGDGADDIGRQSGGWTLTWQGTGVNNSHFPGATSIWGGIDAAVRAAGGTTELTGDGQFTRRPDAAIVVFGETPYAEFQGDISSQQLRPELTAPFATMQRLQAQGIPVIAVMVTGRPLFINPVLNSADAVVVAWLPGSEGGGIADLLITGRDGRPRFDFRGTLPASWPATARADGPVLYPFGHGLRLSDVAQPWQRLSEDPGVNATSASNIWFGNGRLASGWSLRIMDATSSTRVTTLPVVGAAGRIRVAAVDHLAQESARQFTLTGGPLATIEISAETPVDLLRETNGDLMLAMTIRVDQRVNAPVMLGIGCANGQCPTDLPLTALDTATPGEWVTYTVPLKCFARRGATMGMILAPFRLQTTGAGQISVSRVALASEPGQAISCP